MESKAVFFFVARILIRTAGLEGHQSGQQKSLTIGVDESGWRIIDRYPVSEQENRISKLGRCRTFELVQKIEL